MFFKFLSTSLVFLALFISCQTKGREDVTLDPLQTDKIEAKIVSVNHTGHSGNYNFQVGILSPDKGCAQYADWWEVISESGELIYRRVLGHSHVNEQPFVRSGGGVSVTVDQIVIVRAHMNVGGYGTQVFKGSINTGFLAFESTKGFAKTLENKKPQPPNCAF